MSAGPAAEREELNFGDSRLTGNASGTSRRQVGGQALVDGVMMRSRTGYAVAHRNGEGAIAVETTPFRSAAQDGILARMPVARGVVAFSEMIGIARRLAGANGSERKTVAALFVGTGVLPALLSVSMALWHFRGTVANEADHPLPFAFHAWLLRYGALTAAGLALRVLASRRSQLELHGAEHRAIAAYESVREATVARAQRESTHHRRCGTMLISHALLILALAEFATVHVLATQLGGYPSWPFPTRFALLAAAELALVPFAIGLAFETMELSSYLRVAPAWKPWDWPGWLFQRLTVRRPSDAQVEVAIVALEAALSIAPEETEPRRWTTPGLERDESAPGYKRPSLARAKG